MDPSTEMVTYAAPGAVPSTAERAMRMPGANDPGRGSSPWPDPDDHVVEPETRREMWRGEVIEVAPALPGHGDTHTRLSRIVDQYTADGYITSTDLLTRRDEDNDFATDTCVRKEGDNPETGTRHLEELSFEIFHSQSRSYATKRARIVIASGVRRLFGLFVRPARDQASSAVVSVEEWSPEQDAWIERGAREYIHDPCLVRPLSVKALMGTAPGTPPGTRETDAACLRGLIAKHDPLLGKIKRTSEVKGYRRGKEEALRAVACRLLARRFGDLPEWASRRIAALDLDAVMHCIDEAHAAGSLEELLGERH